jgi:thymidylate synthase (FAD)
MKVELVTRTQGAGKYAGLTTEQIVATIARHGIIKEDNGKLVKYLMNNSHWSPLDMINFTFEIETSRAIGRQILRHASIKFQEHSQRYSDRVLFEPIELRRDYA